MYQISAELLVFTTLVSLIFIEEYEELFVEISMRGITPLARFTEPFRFELVPRGRPSEVLPVEDPHFTYVDSDVSDSEEESSEEEQHFFVHDFQDGNGPVIDKYHPYKK